MSLAANKFRGFEGREKVLFILLKTKRQEERNDRKKRLSAVIN